MKSGQSKNKGPGKLRTSVRQRTSLRMVLWIGIPIVTITVLLIIVFQIFKNETTKAEERTVIIGDQLPVDLVVDEMITETIDTNQRNGVRFKIAKPIPQEQTK